MFRKKFGTPNDTVTLGESLDGCGKEKEFSKIRLRFLKKDYFFGLLDVLDICKVPFLYNVIKYFSMGAGSSKTKKFLRRFKLFRNPYQNISW